MYLVVMVGKFVKKVVREWCPSTTGPLEYLVPRDVLLPFHNIVVRTKWCVQRTLPFGPY